MLSGVMLSVIMLNVTYMPLIAECRYAECRCAECRGALVSTQFKKRIDLHLSKSLLGCIIKLLYMLINIAVV